MAIEIEDFPIKTSDFPVRYVSLPEGIFINQKWGDPFVWQELATSKVGRQLIGFVKELTSGTEEAIEMEMDGDGGGKDMGRYGKGDEYGEMVKVDGWLCRDLGWFGGIRWGWCCDVSQAHRLIWLVAPEWSKFLSQLSFSPSPS